MADDETTRIITEFVVVGTDQAITKTKEFDKQVEQLKIQLKTISAETGKPIKEAAEGIRRAFSDSVLKPAKANIDSLKNSLDGLKAKLQEIKATPVSPTYSQEDKAAAIKAQVTEINAVNASLKSAQTQYKQLQAVGVQTNKALSVATQQVVQQQNQLQSATKQTATFFSRLGQAVQTALGIGIFQIISTAIGWLKNAAQSAYEFAKSMYSIEVAVRALRRSGIEITTEAVYKNLEIDNAS